MYPPTFPPVIVFLLYVKDQTLVVQRADNSIQWINRYPVDEIYSNQYILSAG